MSSEEEEDEERSERDGCLADSGCCLIEAVATVAAGCLALAWIIPLLVR